MLSDNVNWLANDLCQLSIESCYVKESVGCIVRMQKRTGGVAIFRRAIYEIVTHRHVFILKGIQTNLGSTPGVFFDKIL